MLCRVVASLRWLWLFIAIGTVQSAAANLLPTSTTVLGQQLCRLDLYHLAKNQWNQIETDFQIAFIADQDFNRRYVALKADIAYPRGFENFSYYRTGQPVEIFTANWKKYHGGISLADTRRSYSISHLVRLGGNNPRQAFDLLIRLIAEDEGRFELQSANRRYRFYLEDGDLDAFFHCLRTN
ncbi:MULTISPECIES: hypothetical protein [unclassified Photobacterium]|uniref:hypothetical protein n=1 Tax=unclassified Photobacterium TaxID=2628852 RepID=UPI001B8C76EC|nr:MULTISPECIES: hypothetical protein [unclassified Photobacterium]MDO6705879.1 hypothetical protein [Photobacterium sp. 1_MG-2023]QUJ69329.1 hypothetical protein KDD30_21400 [Photobacterium sp. GJ3]